ncbi:hypothetical protein GCM10025768_20580 [Microbacterium pseudoresistens]|uniref:Uncharacterized protein n=1 Tax=Microbacterium pseudoresistens TaxID=640634 RepID=A0A7Y9ESW9_9MICO|nr:hypothetical protein [Microbacterium pseudoresistens]NYD53355.1 hypothetical protein [Microbacterium pseudoresistens]
MSEPEPRQRIVRMPGSRRVKLTPAPGTHAEPDTRERRTGAASAARSKDAGQNDERLRRDVPPHY